MLGGFFTDVFDETFESGLQVLKPLAAQKLASENIISASSLQPSLPPLQPYSFAALPVAQSQASTATVGRDKWADAGLVALFLFLILLLRN